MTLRGPKKTDAIQAFANAASHDSQFPKQSEDYDEISSHLELDADYIENMHLFDQVWELYVENNQ
ncbi:hypothetical protein RU97_GL000799 [Enterococcus canis]|uniref:YozE SAM-like domain-containing protein n=2 Tax=Enterococcus canis TaxID=214095 RepID=A0A1L8RHI6_9ENTE|nr:hypothetical protein RU97_GL000799 [Enterococcus canis]